MTTDEDGFHPHAWHDCHVRALGLHVGEPAEDDWTSDLVLDIDLITSWSCGEDGGGTFRVAPARVVFHGVTDLALSVAFPDTSHRVALQLPAIDRVEREAVVDQKVYLDRPYYRWRILLSVPPGGEIAFGAWGSTVSVEGDEVEVEGRQHLTPAERRRALAGSGAGPGDGPDGRVDVTSGP